MTIELHTETYGDGPQEVIVCNGLSQSTANWRGLARANPQFRWILYDARGHGKSKVGPKPFNLDLHVEDLLHVLDKTEAVRPVLMGFSHGARVSLRAAAEHGDRFTGVVLVSCASQQTPRRKAHVTSWHRCLEIGGVRAMAWAALPNIVGRKILHKIKDLEMLVDGSVSRNQEEGLRHMFRGMAGYPEARLDAERIGLPTLVLRGDEDPLVEERDSRELGEWIDGAKTVTFQECGHTLPLEEPQAFLETVENFIDGLT
ncbi:MAG: alpha/beta hydrolase [Acidobacteriota bacterium]|nr:alpha/beta hydrolase [Acidobacteriota bacterium]